jgi:hypothetical protein
VQIAQGAQYIVKYWHVEVVQNRYAYGGTAQNVVEAAVKGTNRYVSVNATDKATVVGLGVAVGVSTAAITIYRVIVVDSCSSCSCTLV